MNAYSQLFKRDPQILLNFPFLKRISKDEYETFLVLKNHSIRVMGIINILVQQLNFPPEKCDPELIQTLQDLGQKHFSYGASRSNIELLGKLFMESFMLPFNEYPDYAEIRTAWSKFFDFIIYWIKVGFQYVSNKGIEM
ncbi:unnamed protein product [Lepeophtheirus salmonis]|uniref:(salmon louse) hypothetical protein n=1 Tax=Lepeophtheirus salmonis TaxID=72036 RepID=A0A7R8CGB0_LEPSM|nr:unnamed protein product [Lepeophtheirus salmonis]CAF2809181.1 unnamed protein product [Lepeophtheirus salmonis]